MNNRKSNRVLRRLLWTALFVLVQFTMGCSDDGVNLVDSQPSVADDGGNIEAGDTGASDAETSDGDANNAYANLTSDASANDASRHDQSGQPAEDMEGPGAGPQGDSGIRPPTGPLRVWLAPDGDDARSGMSEAEAIVTLERAQTIVEDRAPTTDVEIYIKSGRYRGQEVRWSAIVPGKTITFTRTPGATDRPIFDGCLSATNCPGGTWFRLRVSDGSTTGLIFNYIRVENYQTAISLDGNRNSEAQSNGGNRIFGCYFYRIGNVFNPSIAPSTAVIRLVNSDDNEIANNHFHDVINTTQPNRIHAIYAAHMSDRNEIARNRFYDNSGDPVRIRDYSNDNTIVDNTFIKAGQHAGYTEWYCDHDARDDCTKATPECPSWGNQFRRNALDGNYQCDTLGTFEYFQGDTTTGCSPPSATARRLRTSDNTRTSTPCENHP